MAFPAYRTICFLGVAILIAAMTPPVHATYAENGRQLKGAMFVGVMIGNTVAGKRGDGTRYHVYFLNGGIATYADEHAEKDFGRWWLRPEDNALCLEWRSLRGGESRCAPIWLDGRILSAKGHALMHRAELLGAVVAGFQ